MTATLHLLEALIARPSVTPDDAGCQALITERLQAAGFQCVQHDFGPAQARVSNLVASWDSGRPGPAVILAGHTDVVPPGPPEKWQSDPFVPTHRGGRLYGRGAADMKASVAAMVVALEQLVATPQALSGRVDLWLTSDEEGPAVDGLVRLVDAEEARGARYDCCIVGEPTSVEALGDTVKNGRRGTLSARLTVLGKQGHVAYPQLARNPIHLFAPALAELAATEWDRGNAHFPPTSFQVSNIHGGTGAGNVIPGELLVDFNFRFSTESTPESLQARVAELLARHQVPHRIDWVLGGRPFLTEPGRLTQALGDAIAAHTGRRPELSTTGGTSDGRFIARICREVVEFGPLNASIHQVDEWVETASLDALTAIYRDTLQRLLAVAPAA